MRSVRNRITAAFLVASLACFGLAGAAMASPAEESEFVSLINASRSAAGLGSLQVSGDLVSVARRHTSKMAAEGRIFHSSDLGSGLSGWQALGENVGMGPNPSILHDAFMGSSGHRANILGNYTHVGVGAERAPDGTLFVTVVFMLAKAAPATTTTTTAPTATTQPAPAPVTQQSAAPAAKQVSAPAATPAPAPAPAEPAPILSALDLQQLLGLIPGTYCLEIGLFGSTCLD
jgi:hypothetical protein